MYIKAVFIFQNGRAKKIFLHVDIEEAAGTFSCFPILGLFSLWPIGGSRRQPIPARVVIAATEGWGHLSAPLQHGPALQATVRPESSTLTNMWCSRCMENKPRTAVNLQWGSVMSTFVSEHPNVASSCNILWSTSAHRSTSHTSLKQNQSELMPRALIQSGYYAVHQTRPGRCGFVILPMGWCILAWRG